MMATTILAILEAALVGNELVIEHCGEMVNVGRVKSVQYDIYLHLFYIETDHGTAALAVHQQIELRGD